MKITFSAVSDKGLKRPSNQDSIFTKVSDDNNIALFVIADGMGGHYMGEIASEAVTSGFAAWWIGLSGSCFERPYDECINGIKKVINDANSSVYQNYTAAGHTCGSTAVVLFIYYDRYFMMNIGDSRLYEYSSKDLHQISFDHTMGSVYLKKGKITEQELVGNKKYDKLVEAVGCKKEYDTFTAEGQITDNRFILCTDGLYKSIPEKLMQKRIAGIKKPEKLTAKLLKDVFSAGAKDNVSIIIADTYNEKYKPSKPKKNNKNLIFYLLGGFAVLILILIIILSIILLK